MYHYRYQERTPNRALEVHLEMTAPVLWIAEAGTFEVNHMLLGGCRIFDTMAQNSDISGVHHQSLDASLVSCWMGQGARTGKCLEMVTVKAGTLTPVVEKIDSWIPRIECLCLVYF